MVSTIELQRGNQNASGATAYRFDIYMQNLLIKIKLIISLCMHCNLTIEVHHNLLNGTLQIIVIRSSSSHNNNNDNDDYDNIHVCLSLLRFNRTKCIISAWRTALPLGSLCQLKKNSLLTHFMHYESVIHFSIKTALLVLRGLNFHHMVSGIRGCLSHHKSTTKGENYCVPASSSLQMYSYAPRTVLSALVSSFCLPWSDAGEVLPSISSDATPTNSSEEVFTADISGQETPSLIIK